MTLRFRKPQLVPLLFILAATLLLGGLGAWQLQRLAWKEQLIAQIAQAQAEPALGNIPEHFEDNMVRRFPDVLYHNVALTGTFHYDKTLHLIGRQRGPEVGYFMLTPLELEDDGRVVLVNRGFSPVGKDARPQGLQTVKGVARPLREKRLFSPANHPEKNIWFYEDIAAMQDATGLSLLPVVIEAAGTPQAGLYPVPNEAKLTLRNDHLGYAITWFSLMVVGWVMFAFYHHIPATKP